MARPLSTLRISCFLIVLCAASVCATAAAAEVLHQGSFPASEFSWRVGSDQRAELAMPGTEVWKQPMAPELLRSELTLLIPADVDPGRVEIVPLSTRRVTLTAPVRMRGPIFSDEGRPVSASGVAGGDGVFPAAWGSPGATQVWRGYRMLTVTIYPVRVLDTEGAGREIEVIERFEVRAETGAASDDIAVRRRLVPGERKRMEARLRRICDNPGALSGYGREDGQPVMSVQGFAPTETPSIGGSAVSFLIVTSDEMAPEFQRLADHRTAMGMPAVVRSVEWIRQNSRHGVDIQETIRFFIRDAYENWGIEYVLLAGDTDVIPARFAYSSFYPINEGTYIPSDYYYGCLDGNWNADGDDIFGEAYKTLADPGDGADLMNEVHVGRVPVRGATQAGEYVDKSIAYDNQPAGALYPNRALLAAEVLFWEDPDFETIPDTDGADFAEELVDSLISIHTDMETVRMYESYDYSDSNGLLYPGSVRESRGAVLDSLGTGHYGVVIQIGHGYYFNMSVGDANITVTDVDNISEAGRPYLLYALNCASAAFDYACLMERFVTKANGGAIATIGSARAAFPHLANDYQRSFFTELFVEDGFHLGDVFLESRMPWLAGSSQSNIYRWTTLNYTLLGDPTTQIWTGSPLAIDVTAPASLTAGAQTVPVDASAGGVPAAGAVVCLDLDGESYVTAELDASGHADLSFVPTRAGTAVLTVTGLDMAITRVDIPVTVGAAYVAVDSLVVIDNGTEGSSGNGNGIPEAGELVALRALFRDTGGSGTAGASAVMAPPGEGAVLIDDSITIGDVSPGGTVEPDDVFLMELAADIPDGHLATLDITVADAGSGAYESRIAMSIQAPQIEPTTLTWSDADYGDGDHVLEDGEWVTLSVGLKNFGGGLCDIATGLLRTSTPGVSIADSLLHYPAVESFEERGALDTVSFAVADVAAGYECWLIFEDNHGRTVRHDITLAEPAAPDDLFIDTTLGPDILGVHWASPAVAGLRGYHVYRSVDPEGPFVRVNIDLADGSAYFCDRDLDRLTRYYYRVAAVDSSLNEGPLSMTVSASTAPAELAGFPLPFAAETSGSLVVGDIDVDGVNEIVLGADEIYVWDAFGQEHFDGDGNAQTNGPITDLSLNFNPASLVLADLDGQPGLEIVASEKLKKKIHVFRPDGTELDGWPQSLRNGWNWATPAVGDIDGVPGPEIVVLAVDGAVFAWKPDGTEVADGDGDPGTNGLLIDRPEAIDEWGFSSPALCDLDGDGACEIIFGSKFGWSDQNYLYAFKTDGSNAAGFPFATGNGGSIFTSPAVADLDLDGQMEIVFASEDDSVHVVRHDGTRFPGFPVSMNQNTTSLDSPGSSPAVGDFDGDGELEIVCLSVINGANSFMYVLDTDVDGGTSGDIMPGWPVFLPGGSESSPVVGDIDGDGSLDIVYGIGGTTTSSPDNLYAFSSTGQMLAGFPIKMGGPVRPTPVLCDLDRDRDLEIVYGGWGSLLHVWDMPAAFDPELVPWPAFCGNNERNGRYDGPDFTAVGDGPPPAALTLAPNYPNPFNPITKVRLYVPGDPGTRVPLQLRVYDVQGRLVRTLHDGPAGAGWGMWEWDGRDRAGRRQSSGVYFLRAKGGGQIQTRKMTLVK